MARSLRIQYPPGTRLHVFARGNARQNIFHNEADYRLFLDFLTTVKKQSRFRLYSYCLMPNHFHLLVELGLIPLSDFMKRLMVRYAWHYNFRRDRVGHVFQDRFSSIPCPLASS